MAPKKQQTLAVEERWKREGSRKAQAEFMRRWWAQPKNRRHAEAKHKEALALRAANS